MTIEPIDWPRLLSDYRKSRGLKQAAAAQDFRVSQATISRWENGESQPTVAAQNLLFRAARRERSPIDTLYWVETFKRMLLPGAVSSPERKLDVVTEPMAELLGVPADELVGASVRQLFEGDVLELEASLVEAGLYAGRVASFEAVCRVDVSPQFRRGVSFFMHHVGWPCFLADGRIVNVGQGVVISKAEMAETKARLGGALRLVYAD
jgi:transcriptional regulator with XRE-family HTH domain